MFECNVGEGIASIVLAHPPVNALSRAWADAFNRVLDDLDARTDWRVLHVRSSLRMFSAGGDIKEFALRLSDPRAGALLSDEAIHYQKLFSRIEAMPQVSLAEISGVAAGGGFELALACDLRVASDSARVGLPEVGIGLLPSAGGTQRMTRLCGKGKAMHLIGGAELISAAEALSLGLVEWVFPDDGFEEAVLAIATRLAGQPLEALRAAKRCIAAALDPSRDGFAEEAEAPRLLMGTAETRARLEAFVSKAKARS